MHPKTKNWTLLLLGGMIACLLITTSSMAQAQASDQIIQSDGETINGEIQDVSLSAVEITIRGTGRNETIQWSNIHQVLYDDMTTTYGNARQALEQGNHTEAVRQAQQARNELENDQIRSFHLPNIDYIEARGHFLDGNFGETIQILQETLNREPDHPRLLDISRTYVMGRCFQSLTEHGSQSSEHDNLVEELTEEVDEYISMAEGFGASSSTLARFTLLKAELREVLGFPRRAESLYNSNEIMNSEDRSVRLQGIVGRARSLSAVGNYQDALQHLEEYQEEFSNSSYLQASLLNTRAAEQVSEAREEGSLSGLRDALLDYIRAQNLNYPENGAPLHEHRRSLLGSARTYQKLAENVDTEERTSYFVNQAEKTLGELVDLYPSTPESLEAQRLLDQ